MKNKNLTPQDQVFWYLKQKKPQQLRHTIKTDIVIVGGGMAGLSAAQNFRDKGYEVTLLEKSYCGAGATGKSSGFITPESELNVGHLTRSHGPVATKKLWDFVTSGVNFIEKNIKKFSLDCDYQPQDCLVIANSARSFSTIKTEHQARLKLSYESFLYEKQAIPSILGSQEYYGGLRYSQTFGIDAYRYCQAMKEILQQSGVKIYEETPVLKVHGNGADTAYATIQADHIIVCVDRFLPDLNRCVNDVYHAQTFLMLSAPLSDKDIRKIFPQQNLMVWDTDLIYQYYRITGDNRFMIGGGDLFSIFSTKEQHNSIKMFEKLQSYTKKKFPQIPMNFEYFWPGLIGVSKDIVPLAGNDRQEPNIYYISGVAGLPWAAALGSYAAEKVAQNRNDLDEYFSLERKFPIGPIAQHLLGKKITFSLANFRTLYE